jgi:UDP-N-acetylmuramoylalanine--D-glutamate ligase
MCSALVIGHGIEGEANAQFIRTEYPQVEVDFADRKDGEEYLKKQEDFDIAIKSPGLPKGLMTIPYTTGTNLFFSRNINRVIGVTGTKGKSTTASLIHHILTSAGITSSLAGNVGKPLIELLQEKVPEKAIIVAELSSYQLDDIEFSPHIAVALNLFPEHIPYHNSLELYYKAKQNITAHQRSNDVFIYNPRYELLTKWAKATRAHSKEFALLPPLDESQLTLKGDHNKENIQAVLTVADVLNIDPKKVEEAIYSFKPLPHRLERIGKYAGITFYDDAISTTPESTCAAIHTLPDTNTIFLGGEDRGYDFGELAQVILASNIENIVLFPVSGDHMFPTDPAGKNVLRTNSMDEAVKFAYLHTKKDKICLLSCASPSYSLWKNYIEKGNEFRKYVEEYGKKA